MLTRRAFCEGVRAVLGLSADWAQSYLVVMMNLSCHCGAIRLTVGRQPDFLHACNCSLCRKAGAWWGYLHPDEVAAEGPTLSFSRTDKAEPGVAVHFCPTCGSTTHFRLTPAAVARHGDVQIGVNFRLAADSDLAGLELRFPDGQGWSGSGPFGYVRAAERLGS